VGWLFILFGGLPPDMRTGSPIRPISSTITKLDSGKQRVLIAVLKNLI
jgi:hypothetical protein